MRSGLVSLPRMRDMTSLRFLLLQMSMLWMCGLLEYWL